MIARLTGQLIAIDGDTVIIDVNGVGYEVLCSRNCRLSFGQENEVSVIIHTEVKEDSITLYGLEDQLEKLVFNMLKTVKGLGAKTAFEILASIDKQDLLRVIGASDVSRLQAIKGIGKKTAERLIVELRDKVGQQALEGNRSKLSSQIEQVTISPTEEAIEALCALGFSAKQARQAVGQITVKDSTNNDVSSLVKQALQYV